MPHTARISPVLVLLVLLPWIIAPLAAEPRQLYVQPSALAQVVEGLRDASPAAHADFVALTLDALMDAYARELDHSAAAGRLDADRARRLAGWRQAMGMELRRLEQFRLRLDTTTQVQANVDRQGQVLLLVGGSPLLVSWPRVRDQSRREADLVARFCQWHACADLETAGVARSAGTAEPVRGTWSMSQLDGPGWESEAGVRCAFPDLQARADREARCRALATDLLTLARVLSQVRREGGQVQWQEIRIEDEPGGGVQRIRVNTRGDYVLLPLQALATESVDWRAVGRWLERQTGGVRSVETVLRP